MIPIFALMLAPNPPIPISDLQMRDIGCVAALGIITHEQGTGQDSLVRYADLRESGKRWAGIVGGRIMSESGQPREVVAFAIQQAVAAEQAKIIALRDAGTSAAFVDSRFTECRAIMTAELASLAAESSASHEPDWQTDEPDKIALYRTQLGEDLGNPHRIRYCKTLVDISYKEITDREGADSRDAKAFGRLAQAFAFKAQGLPAAEKPKPISAEELQTELEKEPSNEEKMARCLRLGESLALAMPPE